MSLLHCYLRPDLTALKVEAELHLLLPLKRRIPQKCPCKVMFIISREYNIPKFDDTKNINISLLVSHSPAYPLPLLSIRVTLVCLSFLC